MARVYGNPFKVDWRCRGAVIAYAKKLGKGQVVLKYLGRDEYNISHAQYPERRRKGVTVVFRT